MFALIGVIIFSSLFAYKVEIPIGKPLIALLFTAVYINVILHKYMAAVKLSKMSELIKTGERVFFILSLMSLVVLAYSSINYVFLTLLLSLSIFITCGLIFSRIKLSHDKEEGLFERSIRFVAPLLLYNIFAVLSEIYIRSSALTDIRDAYEVSTAFRLIALPALIVTAVMPVVSRNILKNEHFNSRALLLCFTVFCALFALALGSFCQVMGFKEPSPLMRTAIFLVPLFTVAIQYLAVIYQRDGRTKNYSVRLIFSNLIGLAVVSLLYSELPLLVLIIIPYIFNFVVLFMSPIIIMKNER